jgi:hypothetical protein
MTADPPDLRFVGVVGFIPTEPYEVPRDEIWEYTTETSNVDSEGRFTISIKLTEPKRLIASRSNAHP